MLFIYAALAARNCRFDGGQPPDGPKSNSELQFPTEPGPEMRDEL
jgi:hypothetical protein